MMRFIWQNWWRRKDRFILLILGAFIVSAGLTYLIGLSETNKGTVVDTLQQRWTASYDIVVRPDDIRSVTEDKKLLEPNYLSGLNGGISVDQYETIKKITGVDIAAPIALIGYAGYDVHFGDADIKEPGIYRKTMESTVNNGVYELNDESNYYFPFDADWDYRNKTDGYGAGVPSLDLLIDSYSLLAGIDPEQEAKLVGLDEAIVSLGSSRYFDATDGYYFTPSNGGHHELPIIVNRHAFVDKINTISFERLDIPVTNDNGNEVMEMVKENGGKEYLDSIDGEVVQTFTVTGEEVFHAFFNQMTGVDWETGESLPVDEAKTEGSSQLNNWSSGKDQITGILFKPSPLEYNEITSPYIDRWPYSYQIMPIQNGEDAEVALYRNKQSYREPKLMAKEFIDLPRIKPNWIGFYDASELTISKDPMNELPMETYRPATAEYVMDAEGNPINPSKQFKPTDDPYGFLTDPPGMLTTIEAAEKILGDKPISAIRVKVTGAGGLSDESQGILEQVAAEIEERTGLITDITLGSSPQLALTYVPGLNGDNDIGWLQQPWVNIGSSISLFRETKIGFSSVVASVIAVAIVYVWTTGIVGLLARRQEFAVLLSIGWRPSQLSRLLFIESSIIGIFVAITSWTMLGFVYGVSDAPISLERFLWTGLAGFIIYVLGSIIPIYLALTISPYETMRTGEISSTSRRVFQARGVNRMAFNVFLGKWRRNTLSVISIALPTALLAVFLHITFRLKGIMYTSLLGKYVALEIGPAHYAAIIVALIIAILTTAEVTWQNVSERREEISLLQAIGWKRSTIRRLIVTEGIISGLFAALIGLSLSYMTIWQLYGDFPSEEIPIIMATGLVPVIIGIIATLLPAERAVRIHPSQGMEGKYSNRKAVERRLKWITISTSIALAGTFLFTMVIVAPNIEKGNTEVKMVQTFSPTEGSFGDRTADVVSRSPSELEKEQQSAEKYFKEMVKAVGEIDKSKFLSYQDTTNQLFYKEQEIWLITLNQKKKEGWDVSVALDDVALDSPDKGNITLQINMKREGQDISNHITYPINQLNGSWKVNDLPFEKISDGPIHIYYLPSLKSKADQVLADVQELVDLYVQMFAWEPKEVNIKLYDSVEKISASTGWPTLYGVSVPFISNKFVVEGDYEIAYGFMKHEIVHAMLAELTNDNAPHFLQEGLAIFISSSVTRDASGKLQLDLNTAEDREKVILDLTDEIKPIAHLENINYSDDSNAIYNVGFLITNFLVQTYDIEHYLDMAAILKQGDIIQIDDPEKEKIAYERAINALEQTYGSLDALSEKYIEYYSQRK